jgi:two-component system sensor histidine kinase PilS (NtrC family)
MLPSLESERPSPSGLGMIRPRLQATILDPRRLIRGIYVGRFSLATAIFIAAQLAWNGGDPTAIRNGSLIFAVTLIVTAGSAAYTEFYRAPLRRDFLYTQTIFDLLLVTAVVHITGSGSSQFVALYILIIAIAAVLLPTGGGLLIALLGTVFYFADVLWLSHAPSYLSIWLQLFVFATVALGSAYISARLREAGAAGTAAQLFAVRHQAEDVLRNIRSGIITIDSGGRLLYANPAASALLGLPFARYVGRPILGPLAQAAPVMARALERAAKERIRTTRAEEDIRFGDNTVPIGVTTTFSVGAGGGGAGTGGEQDVARGTAVTGTAIFQDISGQKRLDALHIRASRLEAVAELSASLAHEIKNPLASIRSAVEQLARMPSRERRGSPRPGPTAARSEDDARALAALIVGESDRLARLLTEFLDFARVRVTRVSPVDLGLIVRQAGNLAAAHPSRQAGLKLSCDIPDAPVVIDGDEDLLHRAVFNLALNAVQAVPADRGEVRIELAAVAERDLPPGVTFESAAIAIRVIDNGPGIAAEVRDRLFHPFITTKGGGSGLGLSVVHRAIEAHRGCVLVDSGAEGTRFTILVPARTAA